MKKALVPIGVVLVLVIVGFFGFRSFQTSRAGNQALSNFQTEAAKNGSVSVTVGATGAVRANQTATLLWQTSGKVLNVSVEQGQQIDADGVLAELEQSSLPQNVLQAQIDLINAQEALDNAINNSEARADAHLALIQAQQAVDDAEDDAQSMLYQRASQETIDIARANLINANEALDKAEGVWEQTRGAGEDSPIYAAGLSQYARARQEQQQAEYNLRYVQGLPDALSVEEVNVKLEKARAQLLTAKQDWEKIKDGPNPDDVRAAQVRVDIAKATLDLAQLTAPFAGTITQVSSHVGDMVNAGTPAFVVDDLSRLLVDVDVSEVDINQVKVGQPVSLNFDAIPDQEFNGTVTDIASFGSSAGGTVTFTITVEISDASVEIKPGMTAAVNVTVSQLDDVLLVPSRAVRTVDNERVVYVLKNDQPTPVQITLGASSNNYSQITSGDLAAGDLVILNPPANLNLLMPGGAMGGRGG